MMGADAKQDRPIGWGRAHPPKCVAPNATRHVSARSDDNVDVIVRQGGSDGV